MPYYIKVNKSQNVVNIYTKDADGNYTVPFKAMVCSTGTSTPRAGTKYRITTYRRAWNGLKGNVYGQYAVQITGNILFHSVPYTQKNNYSLEYWEYDKLGTKASMGCIRLTVQDAKWIFDNVGAGTWVEFYESDDPGPLGKPTAMIISDNELCRNWDPTDYVAGNPWHETNNEESNEIDEINTNYIDSLSESGNTFIEEPTSTILETENNSIEELITIDNNTLENNENIIIIENTTLDNDTNISTIEDTTLESDANISTIEDNTLDNDASISTIENVALENNNIAIIEELSSGNTEI